MLAVSEHKNIHNELIPRLATGFCSGMARTDGMCGAVSGGVMAIGLALGRNSPSESVDPCYQAVRSFLSRFSQQFGGLTCLELTGVHLGTEQGQLEFREKRQIVQCTKYVGKAAEMVVEIVGSS